MYTMSRHTAKNMYVIKTKQIVIWDRGSKNDLIQLFLPNNRDHRNVQLQNRSNTDLFQLIVLRKYLPEKLDHKC